MTTPLPTWSGRATTLAGALTVRRVLPVARQRAVGPFVFFDHFGPVTLAAEVDSDVGAHPHIGLATVTYLFEGSFLHRDSLGTVQAITPGAINWMTAGSGIAHSERVPDDQRGQARRLHGLQLWVALPPALETVAPSFQHVAADAIPTVDPAGGVTVRVLVGSAWGQTSPVRTASPTLYLDVQVQPHGRWTLPPLAPEMALYSLDSVLQVDGQEVPAQHMALLQSGADVVVQAGVEGARFVIIGGAPLEQPVRMWWNFVASDRERIAAAVQRWEAGDFPAIPGETQRIAAPPWTS
jgi:redox-sensitive bicupin YhaK (pirin superfamily)